MTETRSLPPAPASCLTRPYPSSQKGGTLIAEGVHDLATHEQRLADPTVYRPSSLPTVLRERPCPRSAAAAAARRPRRRDGGRALPVCRSGALRRDVADPAGVSGAAPVAELERRGARRRRRAIPGAGPHAPALAHPAGLGGPPPRRAVDHGGGSDVVGAGDGRRARGLPPRSRARLPCADAPSAGREPRRAGRAPPSARPRRASHVGPGLRGARGLRPPVARSSHQKWPPARRRVAAMDDEALDLALWKLSVLGPLVSVSRVIQNSPGVVIEKSPPPGRVTA